MEIEMEIAKPTQLKPMALNVWMHLSILLISFITIAAECPESGSCEICDLTMSTSLMSVDNVISVSRQAEITFTLNFQRQGHNGFSFKVNNNLFHPNVRDPDFPCTSEADTPSVTQTLEVQYHCTAMEPGIYSIEAYVYYCDRDYNAQTLTVTVENDPPTSTLSTDRVWPPMSSSLIPSSMPPTIRLSVSSSSTTIPITPTASSSRIPANTSTSVSPSSTTNSDMTNNNHEGTNTVVIVMCVIIGLILVVVVMIAVILLLIYRKKRPKTVLCWWSDQPTPDQPVPDHPIPEQPGNHPMQRTQYDSNTAISETSNEASDSYVAASDYPTPVESVSVPVTQLEEVVLESVTQEPDDARTPHQLGENQREVSTD